MWILSCAIFWFICNSGDNFRGTSRMPTEQTLFSILNMMKLVLILHTVSSSVLYGQGLKAKKWLKTMWVLITKNLKYACGMATDCDVRNSKHQLATNWHCVRIRPWTTYTYNNKRFNSRKIHRRCSSGTGRQLQCCQPTFSFCSEPRGQVVRKSSSFPCTVLQMEREPQRHQDWRRMSHSVQQGLWLNVHRQPNSHSSRVCWDKAGATRGNEEEYLPRNGQKYWYQPSRLPCKSTVKSS